MPPEDEVLRLILEVGDLADQGTRRSGEHSDRVNRWVGSDRNQVQNSENKCMRNLCDVSHCSWAQNCEKMFPGDPDIDLEKK